MGNTGYIFDRDLNTWLKTPKLTFGTSFGEIQSSPSNAPKATYNKDENINKPQENLNIENSEKKAVEDDELTKDSVKVNLAKQNWYRYIGFTLIFLSCLSISALILLKRRGNRPTDCNERR